MTTRWTLVALAALLTSPALAGDVSATIGFGYPGVYGQIHIGDYVRPALIYPQPVWVARPPRYGYVAPIYMHVPPGHAKHWYKHCARYGACGRPVYFVREDWFQRTYAPRLAYPHLYVQRSYYDGRWYGDGRGHGRGDDDRDD
jgi:hypothetical protein